MINSVGIIEKGWGHEEIFASTPTYCGKFLHFNKEGARCSMHFHDIKDETWYVLSGKFLVEAICTVTIQRVEKVLEIGSTWRNQRLLPHRIICIEPGTIIEVSTADHAEDNYKIQGGDSQRG